MKSLKESDLLWMLLTNMKKGQKATNVQEATESEKGWKYGAGIELVF